jgi:oligopeptide transport system substrate-binding protein
VIRAAIRGVLLAGLATCAGLAEAGQVLHRPSEAEPDSLDPQKTESGPGIAILRDLFEGLIALDPQGRPVPGDAANWEIAPDGKRWTFHLRPGLEWSNGDPLTSADYLYGFHRLVDPATAAADPSDLAQIANYEAIVGGTEKDVDKLGVEAPDPLTLILHLTQPRLALRFLLTDPQLFPLHRATIEKWGKDWTQPGHLVSNGAFVLKSWVPQSEIVLDKNPNFHDAAAVRLDQVDWVGAEDMDAALRRFRAGELDWMDCLRTNIQICRGELADRLRVAPINSTVLLVINLTKGPLSQDARLREALNLATDRETIVTKIVPLGGKAAYAVTPPVISDYTPPEMPFKDLPMPERIERAKGLMQAAGYGPDRHLQLTLSYATRESTRQYLLAIAHMWSAIWVDLALDNAEFQVFQAHVNARDYEIGIMGGLGFYDDCEDALSNYRSDGGVQNWTGYRNPRFDDLFRRASTSLDMTERRHLLEQAQAVMLADYPVVPLFFDVRNRVVSPRLHGFEAGVLYPQSRYLSLSD